MPAIARGSSARSRRRHVSEDNIEDGDPSQHSHPEDVEDAEDEAQPARVAKKGSKNSRASPSKKGKSHRRVDDDDEASGEEDVEAGAALNIDIPPYYALRNQYFVVFGATNIFSIPDNFLTEEQSTYIAKREYLNAQYHNAYE